MSLRATARIVADADGGLPVLVSDGPLALRRTRAAGPYTRVTVVGAMSAPLGGDRLAIETEVRDGARLLVDSAAATLALPGRSAEPAAYDVRITVGAEGCSAGCPNSWSPSTARTCGCARSSNSPPRRGWSSARSRSWAGTANRPAP